MEEPIADNPVAEKTVTAVCSSCRNTIDVTGFEPGVGITCPYCSHEFLLTRQFGNFLLERQLGSGGMGAVYLAKDITLNRVVAVKVLKRELVTDKKFLATFLREAQITASLNHPNIGHVYTFGEHEGVHYLVIEYVSGGSLDDKITQRGRITELEGIEVGLAVARVLEAALQRGLIHRDIKPGNILFSNNTPKVVDFGLSLSFETMGQFDGEIWGTPYYVPPEKLDHQPEDFRSDMYSLAATLYHAISGHPPYEGEDPNAVAIKHLSGKVAPLKSVAPDVSDKTNYIVGKAMARYPEDRFESYASLIEHLEDAKKALTDPNYQTQHLRNGPNNYQTQQLRAPNLQTQPFRNVGVSQPERKSNNYNQWIIIGLVAAVVLLVGFFVWNSMSQKSAPAPQVTNAQPQPQPQPVPPNTQVIIPTPQPQQYIPAPPPPAPQQHLPFPQSLNLDGYSQIISKSSGMLMAVQNDDEGNNANIVQTTDPDSTDEWQISLLNNGHYKILNRVSGKALAVAYIGSGVWQHDFNTNPAKTSANDEWIIEPTGPDYCRFMNAQTGLALEVKDNSTAKGAVLDQAAWTGKDNQLFKVNGVTVAVITPPPSPQPQPSAITPLSQPPAPVAEEQQASPSHKKTKTSPSATNTTPSPHAMQPGQGTVAINYPPATTQFPGYYQIISKGSGLAITVEGASRNKHANIIQSDPDASAAWQIVLLPNGRYKLVNRNSSEVIAVQHGMTTAGTQVWQSEFDSKPNKTFRNDEWVILPTTADYYRLMNVNSDMALEAKDNSKETILEQDPWTGADNQQFKFVPTQ